MVDGAERVDLPPKLPEYSVVNPQRVRRMDPDQRSGQEAFGGMLNEEKKKSEEETKQKENEETEKQKRASRLLEGIQDGVILSKEAEALLSNAPHVLAPQLSNKDSKVHQANDQPEKNGDDKNNNNSLSAGGHINITV